MADKLEKELKELKKTLEMQSKEIEQIKAEIVPIKNMQEGAKFGVYLGLFLSVVYTLLLFVIFYI